ncbi:MAG: response regulator transcription factor [Dysgonamonadaceae bacterium]|jgi:two-component system LytT family response regulator|nr:response regulator transcription factor [Dysgonamonadaceae bacterium]
MEPITTIIVDDEPSCIKALCDDLQQYPEIEIIETIAEVEKARKAILKQQPQLLFLDVEMPYKNGIQLLHEISYALHSNICVVFYSAYDKYLIDALRVSAFDYLLKPYLPEELEQIIERVKNKIRNQSSDFEKSIRRLLSADREFALQTIKGLIILKRSKILYFQYYSDLRYWQIVLTDNQAYRLRVDITARDIMNISLSFHQINKNIIINIDYLASIDSDYNCRFYPPFEHLDFIISRRYYINLKKILEII